MMGEGKGKPSPVSPPLPTGSLGQGGDSHPTRATSASHFMSHIATAYCQLPSFCHPCLTPSLPPSSPKCWTDSRPVRGRGEESILCPTRVTQVGGLQVSQQGAMCQAWCSDRMGVYWQWTPSLSRVEKGRSLELTQGLPELLTFEQGADIPDVDAAGLHELAQVRSRRGKFLQSGQSGRGNKEYTWEQSWRWALAGVAPGQAGGT